MAVRLMLLVFTRIRYHAPRVKVVKVLRTGMSRLPRRLGWRLAAKRLSEATVPVHRAGLVRGAGFEITDLDEYYEDGSPKTMLSNAVGPLSGHVSVMCRPSPARHPKMPPARIIFWMRRSS